ncbi:hypothetical protein KSP39_PZI018640 [Platanthera zijinensis]|uniref:Uncharacterized protein n=1 Tax=Platanthera zijinensis TaxID=2320716 RepID=A0AAP0B2M7_9ASPA
MADFSSLIRSDPLAFVIADGRVRTHPYHHYGFPTVLHIDLDNLARRMKTVLNEIVPYEFGILRHYGGATTLADDSIIAGIEVMIDAAMAITYNRLRSVAEKYQPLTRTTRMNPKAPISNNLEFPAFISSVLSSIGPLRITDAARDTLVIYSTSPEKMEAFGRSKNHLFICGNYHRLTDAFRAMNVRMAPIDFDRKDAGSFFSTITPAIRQGCWTFYGDVHPSHYENEDIPRAYLTQFADINSRAFNFRGLAGDYCAATNAFIQAAPAATSGNQGVSEDVEHGWVLAHDLTNCEMMDIIRYRIFARA